MASNQQEQLPLPDYSAAVSRTIGFLQENGTFSNGKVELNKALFQKLHENVSRQRRFQCGFCGKRIRYNELSGPYLHSLLVPPVECPSGSPILVAFHKNCVSHVPEVDIQIKDEKVDEKFEIPTDQLIALAVLDRRLRKAALAHESEVYLSLRMALASERIGNKCAVCGKIGAVIGCWNTDCKFTAHYDCVIEQKLKFTDHKVLFCKKHQK